MQATVKSQWIIAGLICAASSLWAILATKEIIYQGDHMTGFRPVISLLVPGAIGGIIAAIHLFIIRRWRVGAAFGLGAVALAIVACNMQTILVAAWARTTDQNALSNETALATIQVDLSPDDLPFFGMTLSLAKWRTSVGME
jgi:hypothetical protein